MFDWLRYFPLALSRGQGYVTPKGPYYIKLRPQQWRIGDSKFHFKAPWANAVYGSRYGSNSDSRSPGRFNILEWPLANADMNWMPNQRWQSGWFFSRQWHFVGPWFTGKRGTLNMSANIIGQTQHRDYENANFFHPQVFETVVTDYLSSCYGHHKVGSKPSFRGPLNWQQFPVSSTITAAFFDIHHIGNTSIDNPYLKQLIIFPIARNRLILITLDYQSTALGNRKIDLTPIFTLAKNITDSFQLDVGPTMQAEWESVKAECPDMSLTEDFAELKWPIKPEDVGKAQPIKKEQNSVTTLPHH